MHHDFDRGSELKKKVEEKICLAVILALSSSGVDCNLGEESLQTARSGADVHFRRLSLVGF